MIAIADVGGVTLLIFYGSTFYGSTVLRFSGSNYRSQVQADRYIRQTVRLQAVRRAQVRQVGRQAGSSQAVRQKSGSVMMEALERTGRLSIGQFVYEGLGIR